MPEGGATLGLGKAGSEEGCRVGGGLVKDVLDAGMVMGGKVGDVQG